MAHFVCVTNPLKINRGKKSNGHYGGHCAIIMGDNDSSIDV